MYKRIPQRVKDEIERLYNNGRGMSRIEILRRTGVSLSSIYGITSLRKRINPETGKLFESRGEQFEYLARQRISPETRRPFKSLKELLDYQTRQKTSKETGKRYKSRTEYLRYLARQKISPETGRWFGSISQLKDYQARQRQQRLINQRLSNLVRLRLLEIGKNKKWLAEELKVTKRTVSRYVNGIIVPRRSLQARLFEVLDLPYKTLDDLVEEDL